MDGRPEHRKNKTLPLISALNLILQQHAARTGVRFGKNRYFFPTLESHPLSLGLEAKKGFFLSVRPTYKQLMVNINVCMTAFYTPGNLAMAMLAFIQHSRGGMPNEFAYNMKITASYRGYPMKRAVKRIGPLSARKTKFDCQEFGGEITVEQYFKKSRFSIIGVTLFTDVHLILRVQHYSRTPRRCSRRSCR